MDQREEHMFDLAGPLDQQLDALTVDRHTNYDLSKPLNLLLKICYISKTKKKEQLNTITLAV